MMGITMQQFAFIAVALLVIGSAVLVVAAKNIFHSLLFLALSFLGVSGVYFLLSADFLAVVQVLIYVGAITVLLMFALMLTHRVMTTSLAQTTKQWFIALPVAVLTFAILVRVFVLNTWGFLPAEQHPTTGIIGRALLTTYLLPFELVSVLLLAAMVGAIVLAKEDKHDGSD